MRKFVLFLLVTAFVSPALAGKTQADVTKFKASGKTGYVYGRSDGVYQDDTSHAPWILENGKPAGPVGVGFYEDFSVYGDGKGLTCLDMDGVGACAGNTALVTCRCTLGDGLTFLFIPLLQQDIAPDMDATGIDIGCDQTNDDGVEVAFGIGGASGRPFVVGDDPAFYTCVTLTIADVSGTDDLHVGFRESEAATATFDNYTDLATIGAISGDIYIETILANASTVSTDTTDNWADAASHKLCVYVTAAGVTTFTTDDAAPTTTAAYTFADGTAVIPFIHYLHAATSPGAITITKWQTGYSE